MDLKQAGNALYLVGATKNELGGSHFALVNQLAGGQVPTVDGQQALATFKAVHAAIRSGSVASCHDLSEGGLAVAAAEMAFAGGFGADLSLNGIQLAEGGVAAKLFSESNSRFLVEVHGDRVPDFEAALSGVPIVQIGQTNDGDRLTITADGLRVIDTRVDELKQAWLSPLAW
jgi:phosphoribosylformylglycinamidine synthase